MKRLLDTIREKIHFQMIDHKFLQVNFLLVTFSLLLTGLLLINGVLTFYSYPKDTDNYFEAEKRISLNAETLLSNLMKSFNMKARSNSNGQSIYPDYYGGCYLDESNNLVILVTGNDSSLHEEDLILRCGGKGFNMKLCQHSYNHLTSLIYSLEDK